MVVKKTKNAIIKASKTSKNNKNQRKNKTQKGGDTMVNNPSIKYKKGNASAKALTCTKCTGTMFIAKTMTLGTKTKAFFKLGILDNRFKVFTCRSCGFVQMYSNEITCDGKSCD
jgi:predicted nucleic-acid-binding Zn-ribbon protein